MLLSLVMPDLGFGLITASVLAFGAVAYSMQSAVTNIPNLALGNQFTVAAYVTWMLNGLANWSIWEAGLAGAAAMAVFSFLMGRFFIRPFVVKRSTMWTMLIVTFLLGVGLQNALQVFFGTNFQTFHLPTPTNVHLLGMLFTNQELWIFALAALVMFGVHALLQYTRVGVAMRAMSDNTDLATACGIHTLQVTDLVWVLTGVLAGIGGTVLVLNTGTLDPTLGANYLLVMVAAAVLGGIGRPYGAMIGAVIVGVVTQMSVLVIPAEDNTAVGYVILLLVLLFLPHGIFRAEERK